MAHLGSESRLGCKDRIFVAMSEHPLHDGIKLYGPALMRRLELVQELTVTAANMEEAGAMGTWVVVDLESC